VNRQGWNLNAARALLVVCVVAGVARAAEPQPAPVSPFVRAGRIGEVALSELSGLAVSRRLAGRWWGLNDSGNAPVLYALGPDGRSQGQVTVSNLNTDWEDLARYEQDGQAYLAIADTGDNFSFRGQVSIWVLAEPALPADGIATTREIRFRYEDGPRDCESLAADPLRGRFLLIDKGRKPAGLYELPMKFTDGGELAVARRIADLPLIWEGPVSPALPAGVERYRGTPTAIDLSPDGRKLLILTYKHLAEFERRADEDWPQALARGPMRIVRLPRQRILEAAGYDADANSALIGGEDEHAALWRWNGRFPPAKVPAAP
jgi:hypothetical protein